MNTKFFSTAVIATLLALGFAQYLVFMVVPNEQIMGAVQRVFYFHVASALACYAAFAVVFVASLQYLASRRTSSDILCVAAGEVGFVLCTITLVTGMIWGHSAWNTWFRWEEPRLVTFLVLWLIFLSFTVLRNFGHTMLNPSYMNSAVRSGEVVAARIVREFLSDVPSGSPGTFKEDMQRVSNPLAELKAPEKQNSLRPACLVTI